MRRAAGGAIEALRAHGPLLGVFPAAEFPEVTVDLQPEDTLLLYTDGLIERNPRLAGDAALRELLASLTFADVDELIAQARGACPGHPAAAPARRHRGPGHPGHRADAGGWRSGRHAARAGAGPRAEGVAAPGVSPAR